MTYTCNLCLTHFNSSQELATHFDEHFSPEKCHDCDHRLILINDELYYLQLHIATICSRDDRCFIGEDEDRGSLCVVDEMEIKQENVVLEADLAVPKRPRGRKRVSVKKKFNARKHLDTEPDIIPLSKKPKEKPGKEIEHIELVDCVDIKIEYESPHVKEEDTAFLETSVPEVEAQPNNRIPPETISTLPSDNPTPPSELPRSPDLNKLPSYLVSGKSTGEKRLRQFQCDICHKYFLSKRTIASHMKLQHEKTTRDTKRLVCDICNRVCSSIGNLNKHKEIHDDAKNYVCSFCGKSFRVKFNMLEHLNSHTGNRPNQCTICDKSYGRRSHLRVHMRMHSGDKPYKCSVEGCGRTYAHGIDLKRHLYGQHKIYTKKFECRICAKVYSENKLLTKHMKTHS